MSTYQYQPLKSPSDTRVLRLKPASRYNDELVGDLLHISLDSNTPGYEALSYVWNNSSNTWTSTYNWSPPKIKFAFYPPKEGEEAPDPIDLYENDEPIISAVGGHIVCDGHTIDIGSELFDALRRVRLPHQQRLLWIDALCINQQNISERNSQVQNMREIYSRADHVLIWVGEHFSGGPASQALLDFITELELLITNIMETYGPRNRKGIESALIEAYTAHYIRWNFLRELLSRAWFGRVWVLQEVVNAKKATIHAGSAKCDWDTIAAITRWLSIYDINGPLNIRGTICSLGTVDLIWKLSRLREDSRRPLPRLIDILAESRLCMSTYAIDKVYGVLGLVCKEDAEMIPIDYGIKAADLYQRIAETELSKTGLGILYHCTKSGDSSMVRCPSWTPDWSQPCYHTSYTKSGYKSSAAGYSTAHFRAVGNILVVKGRIVDSIQAVERLRAIPARFEPTTDEPNDCQATIPKTPETKSVKENTPTLADAKPDTDMNNDVLDNRSWFPNVMRIAFPDNVVTAESYEILWRTCCCNKTTDGDIAGQDFADSFGDWTKAMMGLKLRDFEEFQRKGRRFMESFSLYCDNRRFFRCKEGRLGWGPDQVREGDAICVLNGAEAPFVLRPVEGEGEGVQFEVVGDAYVSGIMDGEAMVDLGLVETDIMLV
ncbi:heterokaryon incompatibility protein-domain-containing protein [Rhexocercosporidium sp. MPI-PUGE-AT-0058]|nr:heterokaryon incompatibility protein-domain-containing protein [Rhexocercosporidium sp. MPI-PUGE-AT-0058]